MAAGLSPVLTVGAVPEAARRRLLSGAMANTNWSVSYPVDPAIGPNIPFPLGGKLVASLASALYDAPINEWTFEVRGEPVESYDEFQRLINEAESIDYAEFTARANGIVVASS